MHKETTSEIKQPSLTNQGAWALGDSPHNHPACCPNSPSCEMPILMSRFFAPTLRDEQVCASLVKSTRLLLQGGYIRQVCRLDDHFAGLRWGICIAAIGTACHGQARCAYRGRAAGCR